MNDLLAALIVSLGINAIFFVAAASLKTDKVTDLSYGLTFLVIAVASLLRSGHFDAGRLLFAAIIILWSLRLVAYLFSRILRTGVDHRFDGIREKFLRFARFWLLQAITVWVVSLPVILYLGGNATRHIDFPLVLGGVIALAALIYETVADAQKSAFHRAGAPGGFIRTGLWKHSRHPNYFGEMVFWWAIFVASLSAFSGAGFLAALGPLFITVLLRFVSGVPLLEKAAEAKHASDPEYRAYKAATSILVPVPRRHSPQR